MAPRAKRAASLAAAAQVQAAIDDSGVLAIPMPKARKKEKETQSQRQQKPDEEIVCKWCKRSKAQVAWRGHDGLQCRTCSRLVIAQPQLTEENKKELKDSLVPGTARHNAWMASVSEWELANPYVEAKNEKVSGTKTRGLHREKVCAIFWPNETHRVQEGCLPKKSDQVKIEDIFLNVRPWVPPPTAPTPPTPTHS